MPTRSRRSTAISAPQRKNSACSFASPKMTLGAGGTGPKASNRTCTNTTMPMPRTNGAQQLRDVGVADGDEGQCGNAAEHRQCETMGLRLLRREEGDFLRRPVAEQRKKQQRQGQRDRQPTDARAPAGGASSNTPISPSEGKSWDKSVIRLSGKARHVPPAGPRRRRPASGRGSGCAAGAAEGGSRPHPAPPPGRRSPGQQRAGGRHGQRGVAGAALADAVAIGAVEDPAFLHLLGPDDVARPDASASNQPRWPWRLRAGAATRFRCPWHKAGWCASGPTCSAKRVPAVKTAARTAMLGPKMSTKPQGPLGRSFLA